MLRQVCGIEIPWWSLVLGSSIELTVMIPVSVTKYLIALNLIFKSYIKLSLECSFQMWDGGL